MDDDSGEKLVKCWKCSEYHPASDYSKTPIMGWGTKCIHCKRKEARENMKKYKTDECRAHDNVRAKTNYLIKTKKLIVADECAKCRKTEDLQCHHPKPYDPWNVIVLCRKICHEEEHPERFTRKYAKKK